MSLCAPFCSWSEAFPYYHSPSTLLFASSFFTHKFPCAASEATLVNLGHVYRRQKRWPEAIATFKKALGLAPGHASTYAALAFAHHLQVSLLSLS